MYILRGSGGSYFSLGMPLELRRLPPPLPPPPPGECSGVCPVEPPYQSRPLLQRRRRHSSAASAAALCSPSSAAAPQPPASAARTPRAAATLCRPLGPRPRPPRRAGRRLRLRAVDAAATDADASSSAPRGWPSSTLCRLALCHLTCVYILRGERLGVSFASFPKIAMASFGVSRIN